jgi:hypothetical protein
MGGVFTQPGSNSEVDSHSRRVRSTPMNGHHQTGPTGPFRANNGSPLLFDHLVGKCDHWKVDAECLRCLEIKDEIEFGCRRHRQVASVYVSLPIASATLAPLARQTAAAASSIEATAVRSETTSHRKHLFDLGLEFLRAQRLYDKDANTGLSRRDEIRSRRVRGDHDEADLISVDPKFLEQPVAGHGLHIQSEITNAYFLSRILATAAKPSEASSTSLKPAASTAFAR